MLSSLLCQMRLLSYPLKTKQQLLINKSISIVEAAMHQPGRRHPDYQGPVFMGAGSGGPCPGGSGGGGMGGGGGGAGSNRHSVHNNHNRRHHSSRRIARFPAPHGHQDQQSRHGQSSVNKSARYPPAPPPPDPLSLYTFDDITPDMLRSLDIYPSVLEDLLQPGKGVCYLTQIIVVAENQNKKKGGFHFEAKPVSGLWVGFLTINFPEQRTFTCKHGNKKEAKNLCSLAAVYELRRNNHVDAKLKLNVDVSVANNFIDNARAPISLMIPMGIKQQMMSFVSKFDEHISNLIEYRIDSCRRRFEDYDIGVEGKHAAIMEGIDDEGIAATDSSGRPKETITNETGVINLFSSRRYVTPDSRRKLQAYSELKKVFADKDRKYHQDKTFNQMSQAQRQLPIRSLRDQVVTALQNHRCIVVAGETGSGKSTQVPQFILETFISNELNSNSFANIAITQPRRISAISLADRVAAELGEPSVGHTVGHNVRFHAKPPKRDLNIMTFFTTGMLLKKLQRNPDLQGVSHLVIDEVHERDCTTDFLLILVKRLLARRRDLKVILMSASMDAALFSLYFDQCPVISVSGRCYPVEQHYLEDICKMLSCRMPRDDSIDRAPKIDMNFLKNLLCEIDSSSDEGSILCFMPGWKDMRTLQDELTRCRSRNHLKVLLVHSKLPIADQRLIFSRPGPNERKIILATNIAETSITISDVRYVVDTGLCNSIDYDPNLNMSAFGTRWISRANAKQRSGRAGRTAPGECFKLYTRHEESFFLDFPFPELLRIPLESVIMDAKCHCPDEKAVNFLSQAIQPPSTSAIHSALDELILLGVLDHRENLTVLGRRIADFSTHPRLSVSLIVASALRCLYPVLNSSAILSSTQEPFLGALSDKSQIRLTKERICAEAIPSISGLRESFGFMSDHLAFANILAQYDTASNSKYELDYFAEENKLNRSAMTTIQECRNLYARLLRTSRFVGDFEWYSPDSLANQNQNDLDLMIAALTYSFYPKVVRIIRGVFKGGRIYPNKVSATDVQSNTRVRFSSDSIVRNISLGKQPNANFDDNMSISDEDSDYLSMSDSNNGPGFEERKPAFLTYLNSRADQEAGHIVIRDGSVVPPLTLLLFGGRDIAIYEPPAPRNNNNSADPPCDPNFVHVGLDRYNLLTFRLPRGDARLVQEWRRVWQKYLDWYIHTKDTSQPADSNDNIIAGTMNEFLLLLKKLYSTLRCSSMLDDK